MAFLAPRIIFPFHPTPSHTPPLCSATPKRPYGYWTKRENILHELQTYVRQTQTYPHMPTASELHSAGREDLAGAIRRYSSWQETASEAGLVLSSISRPRSLNLTYCTDLKTLRLRPYKYWRKWENLQNELSEYIKDGCMPTSKELQEKGRSDLIRAIGLHGGWRQVGSRMGCATWMEWKEIEEEIKRVWKIVGRRPTWKDLKEVGKRGVASAVGRRWGGLKKVLRDMEMQN